MEKKVKQKLEKFKAFQLLDDDDFSYRSYVSCYKMTNDSVEFAWKPQSDIYLTENELVYCISIPFVDPSKIEVIIELDKITIKGERKKNDEERKHYYMMNIEYGPFEIRLNIPVPVQRQSLSKEYIDGLFYLRLKLVKI
ncbi:MAG: Hsp20/alpha crystallin family protein [Candidatus Delongbacteria bacterium]|nr:Hsp20/alpha crystallin family protein [Candidatus Delongbacteria bacterium]MBN2836133.1 Hsp20/alpha crystallin family protein [Candidatus Delongbacteria bacterium]